MKTFKEHLNESSNEMTLSITLPKEIKVDDYHEFYNLEIYFRELNKNIKIKEVAFNGDYIGIVYTGSLMHEINKKFVQQLKAKYKEVE
jgi:phage antirepressor YoqD-like protein